MTEQERQNRLRRLHQCIKLGEDSYDQMYEPRTYNNTAGHYSDAKDFFGEAIGLARDLGLNEQAQALTERLAHIKAVFRSQFSGFDSSPLPTLLPTPVAQPAPDSVDKAVRIIRANAAFVINTCQELTEFDFNYSPRSVKWLDEYIEQIRTQPASDAGREQLVSNIGSYLGEAIIEAYGGAWSQDESGWCVRFDEQNRAYPFNKVAKQFLNGSEDSIFSFYSSMAPLILHIRATRLP